MLTKFKAASSRMSGYVMRDKWNLDRGGKSYVTSRRINSLFGGKELDAGIYCPIYPELTMIFQCCGGPAHLEKPRGLIGEEPKGGAPKGIGGHPLLPARPQNSVSLRRRRAPGRWLSAPEKNALRGIFSWRGPSFGPFLAGVRCGSARLADSRENYVLAEQQQGRAGMSARARDSRSARVRGVQ